MSDYGFNNKQLTFNDLKIAKIHGLTHLECNYLRVNKIPRNILKYLYLLLGDEYELIIIFGNSVSQDATSIDSCQYHKGRERCIVHNILYVYAESQTMIYGFCLII